jgi:hypothetical protein
MLLMCRFTVLATAQHLFKETVFTDTVTAVKSPVTELPNHLLRPASVDPGQGLIQSEHLEVFVENAKRRADGIENRTAKTTQQIIENQALSTT